MDSISVLSLISSRPGSGVREPWRQSRLFEAGVFLPVHRCWRGFGISLILHSLAVYALAVLPAVIDEYFPDAKTRRVYNARPMNLRVQDKLFLAGGSPRPVPKPKPIERRAVEVKPKPAPAPALASRGRRLPARPFQLPDIARKPQVQQTLLQPQFPPDLALERQVRLPQMFFWATAVPKVPRPAAKPFVQPGYTGAKREMAALDAPPRLQAPRQELALADLKAGALANAKLTLPKALAPAMPIRVFRPPTQGAAGSGAAVDPFPGEPVNLLALSLDPPPLQDRVVVPPGNQIAVMPAPDADDMVAGLIGAPGRAGDPGALRPGAGSGGGGSGVAGTGTGSGSGAGVGTGAASGFGTGGSGTGGIGLADAEDAVSALAAALSAKVPIRVEHPTNGVFDVVVVQSSSEGGFPESAGVLTGKPIYTVYLRVGAQKDWVLQYCVPREAPQDPVVAGNVVRIGAPSAVKAPYPLLTVVAPAAQLPRASYIMVHGFVDTKGQFKELTVLRAPDRRIAQLVLPFLEKWQFRPATRDGRPVQVEILLALPPTQG